MIFENFFLLSLSLSTCFCCCFYSMSLRWNKKSIQKRRLIGATLNLSITKMSWISLRRSSSQYPYIVCLYLKFYFRHKQWNSLFPFAETWRDHCVAWWSMVWFWYVLLAIHGFFFQKRVFFQINYNSVTLLQYVS